jgi:Xaa-Pro dipeptidase
MKVPDLERWNRVKEKLAENNLAGLVCRLTENVLMLSGYWPILGRSIVVFFADYEPVLLAPISECEEVENGWISDVRTFRAWRIGDDDPEVSLTRLLDQVFTERGIRGKRIGYEGSFGDIAAPQRFFEPWAGIHSVLPFWKNVSGGGEWVDFGPQLVELSGVKTECEIERIRLANEVADFGLEAFFREVTPGKRESEIAAAVESAVLTKGIGYKGITHARGEAEVISGIRTGSAWDFPTTTDRVIENGELVLIEFAVVADGYWSDLTRTVVAGSMNDGQRRLATAQRAAYKAALQAMLPGVPEADPDAAARKALEEYGMRDLFAHHTGHGIGFRYHEAIPSVHPDSIGTLQAGMVTSLEPGLYGETFGYRVEDIVLITSTGAEPLCKSSRWPGLEG